MWWMLAIPAAMLLTGTLFVGLLVLLEARRPRVICLMYHRVADRQDYAQLIGTERIFTLPAEVFDGQIAHLKSAGYSFVTPEEFRGFVSGERPLRDLSVLITFDDGCASVTRAAAPILARHGACGTVFVTTDPDSYVFRQLKGRDRRLTDEELRATDGSALRYESHAVTHRPLRGLPDAELRFEMLESKRELERILGREVAYLAIPGNWYDRRVMRAAREAGYKAVWYSLPGTTRAGQDLFGLPRVNVEGHMSVEQFAAAISPLGIVQRRLASLLKRMPGRILGPRYWEPLRRLLMRCIPGGYLTTRRVLTTGALLGVLAVVGVLVLLSL